MLVFLDPGHGGSDPGATANGLTEKDLNLTVGLACRNRLAALGVPVLMSRESDADVTLAARVHLANTKRATCFVSLHHNAANNPDAQGFEIWHSIKGGEGKRLAGLIESQLVSNLGIRSRSLKSRESESMPGRDYHYVIRHTAMPAVIVEGGFITNAHDAAVLMNPAALKAEGEAIADAVAAWLGVKQAEGARNELEVLRKEKALLEEKLRRIKAILDPR